MASVFTICSSRCNLFSSLMGGTTTVQTVDLVSGLTEALASLFLLLLSTKPFSTKGLSCPEESELGEPSTVSHPLSCSSSDMLLDLLQGEGLDCSEELVLRVLSGLLREHTRSMFRVFWQASHSRLPLHLHTKKNSQQTHQLSFLTHLGVSCGI